MVEMVTPRYNHPPIDMERVATPEDFTKRGHFAWEIVKGQRKLHLAIPYLGNKDWVHSEWTIDHRNESNAQWSWDPKARMAEDRPTLRPSLHAVGIWHGHVRDGKLVEA